MSSNISPNDLINLSSHVVRIPKSSIELMNQFLFSSENRNKYLIERHESPKPLMLMIGIIDETMESFDKQTQDIILDFWSEASEKTFKEMAEKYNCKNFKIYHTVDKCSVLKAFKYMIPLEDIFLGIITKTLRPLIPDDLFNNKKDLKYSPNLYFGILAYIYDHVPFAGHMRTKEYLSSVYKCIYNPKRKMQADTYIELLDNICLPFGEVTVEHLFELVKISSAYEKLVLLNIIFTQNKYEFIQFNSSKILIRKGNYLEIILDIITEAVTPVEESKLIDIFDRYYQRTLTAYSIKAIMCGRKDIVKFVGDRYGLRKHKHSGRGQLNWAEKKLLSQ